jgi:hypothetical protein
MTNINQKPLETVQNLLNAFPNRPELHPQYIDREVPLGIEIEVPWRAFFPDLWVEGFPNVDEQTLAQISEQCSVREAILIPMLCKTVECGVNKGADKYWEFAFDPSTDISITCNQVEILRVNNLIPPGNHSLHITFGGLRANADVVYMAMALEAYACDQNRILAGFHPSKVMSTGWARKGYAGVFEKEGVHDVQHGYQYAAEIRLLYLPSTGDQLFTLLDLAQRLAECVRLTQAGHHVDQWQLFKQRAKQILVEHGLPPKNWKKPHMEPDVWQRFGQHLPSISRLVQQAINELFPSNAH